MYRTGHNNHIVGDGMKCKHCGYEHEDVAIVKIHETVCLMESTKMLDEIEMDVLKAIQDLRHPIMKWWPSEKMLQDHFKDKYTDKEIMRTLDLLIAGDLIDSGWKNQGGWMYVYWVVPQ